MGGSASVCNTPRKQAISAFVDATLRHGEASLKSDTVLRLKFVDFIKGGAWVDSLIRFEDSLNHLISSSDSPWRKFGYKSPNFSNGRSVRTSFDKESSFKSYSTESECDSPSKSSSSMYKQMIMDECYSAITSCQLFKKEELRSVLFAALLPLFLKSLEDNQTRANSGGDFEEDDEEEGEEEEVVVLADSNMRAFDFVKTKTPPTLRSERLQEWLLGAAAMFDSFELEAYLADTNSSWIDDYLGALRSLPVTVTLSTVDASKHESKIIYANCDKGIRGQVGANMHEVYSADCTAYVVGQVTKAVFSAKKYKRCVTTPNGMYKLRALKPVFDTTGQHAYTLGLESNAFEDPIIQDKFRDQVEAPFQQMEDLLLMLPMLVRNFNQNAQSE